MDFTPGAELPPLVRKTGFHHWNRFAAINDEFVPIHMDDEAGRAAGFPTAIGMGNLVWSYFHRLLRDAMGADGRIETVSAQYRLPNIRDSTLTISAKVLEATPVDGGTRVVFDLRADDDADRQLANGQATVLVRN